MNNNHYLFSSESVSDGHPDKVSDQISDSILDAFLAKDPNSKVACETLVTTGQVVIAGEVKSEAHIDVQKIVRGVINKIGYNKSEYKFDGESCGILVALHEQSADINRGVSRVKEMEQGAGDQGMMFGYATNETDSYMPITLYLANKLLLELKAIREEGEVMTYLRPDSKSQVTIEFDENNNPVKVHTILISTQHDNFIKSNSSEDSDKEMLQKIFVDIKDILIPRVLNQLPKNISKLFDCDYKLLVNPTGKFVIGGPYGDTGLTGRKIIVDTYGGRGAHGGGAFSGKDPSKVDRSAAYAARYIAKNMVASGLCSRMLVQISYAIGVANPINVFVNTYGTCNIGKTDKELSDFITTYFDLRPRAIEKKFNLRTPIYEKTASFGHFGRNVEFGKYYIDGKMIDVEYFPWEKLDCVEDIKRNFC